MARAFEGEFLLSDRSTTGKLNVYVVEKDPETDEPQFTGWADIPTGKAGRLVKSMKYYFGSSDTMIMCLEATETK